MHVTSRTTTAVVAVLGTALGTLALTATPATAAAGDRFVVDTQFYAGQSRVVDATGVFDGCRLVRDFDAGFEELEGGTVRFTGSKRVLCGSSRFVLDYDAILDPTAEAVSGTWTVTSSSLSGVDVGDTGTLVGDPTVCTTARHAGGCVTDTFVHAG